MPKRIEKKSVKMFFEKLNDPEQRKLFFAIFGGKLLGVAVCFALMFCASLYFGSPGKAHAQEAPATAPAAAPAEAEKPAAAPAAEGTSSTTAVAPVAAGGEAPAPARPLRHRRIRPTSIR